MALIPQEKIDEVLATSNIVEVVSEYVQLEKKGKNFFGLCPFHSEKTPSFSVAPDKGIYHCFSCGNGGNAIKFIQEMDQISYPEAIVKLADKYQIDIDYHKSAHLAQYEKLYEILELSNRFYMMYLQNTLDGKKALEYLQKRQIDDQLIKRFNIGLAPMQSDIVFKTLTDKKYDPLDLVDSGIVRNQNDRYYDLFRNRIMFPLKDLKGKIVGYSGRVYSNDNKQSKYMNSSENKIFKKSEILYNYSDCVNDIKEKNNVYLFEGFMDAIKAVSVGVTNSVASMGTALTQQQAQSLKDITNNVTICYDGDKAGMEATLKAFHIFRPLNMNVYAIHFKDGLDPDDFINQYGKDEFLNLLDHPVKEKEFKFLYYYSIANLKHQRGIDNFSQNIFELIDSSSENELEYLRKLASVLNTSYDSIVAEYENYTNLKIKRGNSTTQIEKNNIPKKYINAEKILVRAALVNRAYCMKINSKLTGANVLSENADLLMNILSYYQTHDKMDVDEWKQSLKEGLQNFFNQQYSDRLLYQSDDQEIEDSIRVVKHQHPIYLACDNLREKLKKCSDDKEKIKLMKQIRIMEREL